MAAIAPIPSPVSSTGPMNAGLLQLQQAAQASSAVQSAAGAAQQAPLASFQDFLADAVKRVQHEDSAAAEAQQRLLVGDSDSIHEVMIAMEKASLSLQLTLAVRNKVVEAYQEVMRMQL